MGSTTGVKINANIYLPNSANLSRLSLLIILCYLMIVTGYRLDDWGVGVQVPVEITGFLGWTGQSTETRLILPYTIIRTL
jgi:hypothetical protein